MLERGEVRLTHNRSAAPHTDVLRQEDTAARPGADNEGRGVQEERVSEGGGGRAEEWI